MGLRFVRWFGRLRVRLGRADDWTVMVVERRTDDPISASKRWRLQIGIFSAFFFRKLFLSRIFSFP